MELNYKVKRVSRSLIFEYSGKIGIKEAQVFTESVKEEVNQNPNYEEVAIDCSAVLFIDSSGMGELINLYRWFHEKEKFFCVIGLSSELRTIIRLAKLNNLIPIFSKEEYKKRLG
ncbi:MAG: STAS domain-containing protein [Spirochaetota bacterium]